MAKRHIITITGDHASGQGTLSNFLNKDLGYEIYRNGQYVRKLALDMGMSIIDFQTYLNEHPELDNQIEKSASDYAALHDNVIIDAKLGWYAVPYSFKIYLKVDIDVAAKRAFMDENRKSSENYESVEHAKEKILYRYNEENKRWFETREISCPEIKEDNSYGMTENNHMITIVDYLDVDKIYKDLFEKLEN